MKQVFDLRINMGKGKAKKASSQKMIFMGTGDYGGAILSALLLHDYQIAAVITRPDRKGGRKGKGGKRTTIFNAVKDVAINKSIKLLQPEKIDDDFIKEFKSLSPNIVVVASYGRILPKAFLDTADIGFVNVHASLLPKYRGASPIQNAILFGEEETGTTIMHMDDGMDTGDIIAQEVLSIDKSDTSGTLFPKMAQHGADLLITTLPHYLENPDDTTPQKNSNATLCQLIEREDGHVQWSEPVTDIFNRFKALSPWPGLFGFWYKNETDIVRIKFLDIEPVIQTQKEESVLLGEVYMTNSQVCVRTRNGCVILKTVQMEGRKEMDATNFIKGNPDFIGTRLH